MYVYTSYWLMCIEENNLTWLDEGSVQGERVVCYRKKERDDGWNEDERKSTFLKYGFNLTPIKYSSSIIVHFAAPYNC